MKTTTRVAVLATVGVLAVGGLAATTVAMANAAFDRPGDRVTESGPGPRHGDGMGRWGDDGMRREGMGHGRGPGAGPGDCQRAAVTAPKGELTAAQQRTLAAMAEEEKLAHDLYAAFGDRYAVPIFDRIAASETRHLTVVRTLLDRYDVTDPTVGRAAGSFTSSEIQATYDRLLAEGSKSQAAALNVAQRVERTDIADLRAAQQGLTAPDVRQVYGNLLQGSEHHLTAFTRVANR